MVEDLIVDAMAKGEFENLKGTGKPLPDRVKFKNIDSDRIKSSDSKILVSFLLLLKDYSGESADTLND